VVRVDVAAIGRALCLTLLHAKLLVEPSAAAGLAGAFEVASTGSCGDVGVVLTGGNVEPELIARLITEHGAASEWGTTS
jgi:threonine dehydratase